MEENRATTYYYAYINDQSIVEQIVQMPTPISIPNYISIPKDDQSLIGKRYNKETGEFETVAWFSYVMLNGKDIVTEVLRRETQVPEPLPDYMVAIPTYDESLVGKWYNRKDCTFSEPPIHVLADLSTDKINVGTLDLWLSDKLDNIDTAIDQANAAVDNMYSSVSGMDGKVNQALGTVTTLDGKVVDLTATVASNDGKVTELAGTITTLDGKVVDLTATVAGNDGKVTELAGTVTTLDGKVADLTATVASNDGKVTELAGTVSNKVLELEGKIARVEDGLAEATSYIYYCTGTADDVAITTLANDFMSATGSYASSFQKYLKLIVVGVLGISVQPMYGPDTGTMASPKAFFGFGVAAMRSGASIEIDWSNATFPPINNAANYTALVSSIPNKNWNGTYTNMQASIAGTGTVFGFHFGMNSGTITLNGCQITAESNSKGASVYAIFADAKLSVYGGSFRAEGRGKCIGVELARSDDIVINGAVFEGFSGREGSGIGLTYNANGPGTLLASNSIFRGNSQASVDGYKGIGVSLNYYGTFRFSNCTITGSGYFSACGIEANTNTPSEQKFSVLDLGIHVSDCTCSGYGFNFTPNSSNSTGSTAAVYVNGNLPIFLSGCFLLADCGYIKPGTMLTAALYCEQGGRVSCNHCVLKANADLSNTTGPVYGVFVPSASTLTTLRLVDCTFTHSAGPYTYDAMLGVSGAVPKYHITGCSFYSSTINVGGSNIASATASANAYMPQYSNFWGITT